MSYNSPGTAPQAWVSTSRSCWAACSTATASLVEKPTQRSKVDGQRIDQRGLATGRELHESELGEVRALAVELGVEGVPRFSTQVGR